MRFFSACLAIFLIFLFSVQSVFAHSQDRFAQVTGGQINEALAATVPLRFIPSHPLYFLITIKETGLRMLKPSSVKKAEFDFILCGKRLKEVYLLLEKNDVKNASRVLTRYSKRLSIMTAQMEKAKSQNQDTTALVDQIVEGLGRHEILLAAIEDKFALMEDSFSFDEKYKSAVEEFIGTIKRLEIIKPGVKNRFKIVT